MSVVCVGVLLGAPGAQSNARSASSGTSVAPLTSKPDRTYVTNGSVNAVDRVGDTIYIGGDFSEVGPRTGPFVGIDSSNGKGTGPLPPVSGGSITSVSGDGSGGWYIGGSFTHVGGIARNGLAHILSTGSLDASFDPSHNGEIDALLYFGGTLYVAGSFTTIGGQARSYLAQLDANGNATSWNPAPDSIVSTLAVHPSNSVLHPATLFAAGEFQSIGGQTRHFLAQLNLDGTATTWNPNPNGIVDALWVSGAYGPIQIYASGSFTSIGGQARLYVAQLDGYGNATSWNANSDGEVFAFAVSANTVYVGGGFHTIGGQSRAYLAALDTTTGNATSWNPQPDLYVYALAVSGNTVYVGGQFTAVDGLGRHNLASVDATTGDTTSWNPDVNGAVAALGLYGTTVYAGGNFSSLGGTSRSNLAAINAATGAPTSWNPGTDGAVNAIAVSNGTVYVGGNFGAAGDAVRHGLAALSPSTGAATGWDPAPNSSVKTLAVSGSTVYVGGYFTSIGGQTRNYVAALDATTAAATSWNPDSDGGVEVIRISNGTIYVGGAFGSIGGAIRSDLAALDATTGAATAWNPDALGPVEAIAISGSRVYLGGEFTSIGGSPRSHLAAVETNGTLDAWNPGADGNVYALAVSGSTLYAGGDFSFIGTTGRRGLAAIGTATGLATSWNPGAVGAGRVLQAYPDGSLYAGGDVLTMSLAPQQGFASFSMPPSNTAAPAIVGAVHVGQQLTCSKGSWSGSTPQTYTYAWLRDGVVLTGATSTTYTPKLADAGHKLSCRVTAKNLGGGASAASAAVSVPPAPSATTAAATAITQTTATLNGSVNPHGEATTVLFQYGTTTAYGAKTPAQNVGSGTSGVAVAGNVAGLAPSTVYHFRIVASSASGTTFGADKTFTTSTTTPARRRGRKSAKR